MSQFSITIQDLQNKIDYSSDANKFSVSSIADQIEEIILWAETLVLSALPYRYRKYLNKIEEYYFVRDLSNEIRLSITPIPSTLKIYKNFMRLWETRTIDDLYTGPYTLAGKILTFPPGVANINDRFYLEYEHNNSEAFAILKNIAVNLCVVEIAKRTFYHRDEMAKIRYDEWYQESMDHLERLAKGHMGLPALDNIKWVNPQSSKADIVDSPYDFVNRFNTKNYLFDDNFWRSI
jgi:hypothetical protein